MGRDREVQLTDTIMDEILAGRDVYRCQFEGQQFDCGSKIGFLKATVAFVLARPDLCVDLQESLARTRTKKQAAE